MIGNNFSFNTVAELRSTKNAQCTITIRFVYEYATLYVLHATPYVRMLRRVYDPKRVSPINYTNFSTIAWRKIVHHHLSR